MSDLIKKNNYEKELINLIELEADNNKKIISYYESRQYLSEEDAIGWYETLNTGNFRITK